MTLVPPDVVLDGLSWLGGVFWSCALFYVPWRVFAVTEARVTRLLRRRRESVDR